MKKIIVRDRVLQPGYTGYALISLTDGERIMSSDQLVRHIGLTQIMKSVYCESFEFQSIEDSDLFASYSRAASELRDNDDFKIMYAVEENFAVHLDKNIYLYHLVPNDKALLPPLFPWFYADSKKFIGDTWWETDEEILKNIKMLTVIDFLKLYKGY